jgi:hypothetical protein
MLLFSVGLYAVAAPILVRIAWHQAAKEKGYPKGILGGFFMTPVAPFLWPFFSSADWLFGIMMGELLIKYALVRYADKKARRFSA